MIFSVGRKSSKPEQINRKASISMKSLKLNPKEQIKKIKSLVTLNTQKLSNEYKNKRLSKRSSIYKGNNLKVVNLLKEFDANFSILDADKTSMLNYSRFCILLQALYLIDSPSRRSKEERMLVVKAWKLISEPEGKMVWKGNAFNLFLAIMNVYDKSIQSHDDFSSLGKMISGIYCIKKDEIKSIHKLFSRFYQNRMRTFSSTSPETRAVLKKNLSFEEKKTSLSPEREALSPKLTSSTSISDNYIKRLHSSILEKTIESNQIELSEAENFIDSSKIVEIKELDSSLGSVSEFNLKGRLRIRLSTSILQMGTGRMKRDRESLHRSITVVNKNFSSFAEIEDKSKDGQDVFTD